MEETLRVNFVHVSGKLMIAKVTDGLSRGLMTECVKSGKYMMLFLPQHLRSMVFTDNIQEWRN